MRSSRALRLAVSVAISLAFGAVTLSRVDLGAAVAAAGKASLVGLAIALAFVWLEILVRAWRWRFLLSPLGNVRFGQALAYTCIGYFTNSLLPMRLGDVARAYLAGSALGLPRLATLGSVVVERLVDGMTILVFAAGLSFVVLDATRFASVEVTVALGLTVLTAFLASVAALVRWRRVVATRLPARVSELSTQMVRGGARLRTPRGLALAVAYTAGAYCCAIASFLAVSGSVGLHLTPVEAAFAASWIALSTAIPAAPGSVGTYEFAGVSALTLLGRDPATALAAVVLIHVLAVLPVSLVGLAATWHRHLRVWRIAVEDLPADAQAAAG